MTEPTPDSFLALSANSGFHRIAYMRWGEPHGRRATVCVHGLTRNSRDFDFLAAALAADDRFVVCPDVAGRGASDWLVDPGEYTMPVYAQDMAGLLGRIGAERVDWIGTSMGGLIGMLIASADNSPIHKLVLNDIGPFLPKVAVERIADYVGATPGPFASLDEVDQYLRQVHAPFGDLTDAQWAHMARHSARQDGPGRYSLHYDPRISEVFAGLAAQDVDMWRFWDRITCEVLVLRGADSDLLTPDVAERMASTGPKAEIVEIAGCGHAPALMNDEQIGLIGEWLAR